MAVVLDVLMSIIRNCGDVAVGCVVGVVAGACDDVCSCDAAAIAIITGVVVMITILLFFVN